MSNVTDESILVKKNVQANVQEVPDEQHERTFFPFQEDTGDLAHSLRTGRFPRLGFGALLGAVFLIVLSAVLLRVIAGPAKVQSDWTVHVWHTHRYISIPKPAAWLSAILSFISVLFHIALNEGVNITWWYQVRREDATIEQLHEVWDHGNSSLSAVKSGFKDIGNGAVSLQQRIVHGNHLRKRIHFSYVALATLFVATIPLNGFLLQNAVTVESKPASQNGTINVPVMTSDMMTTAVAVVRPDSDISRWSRDFGHAAVSVRPQLPAVADLKSFDTSCPDTCKAKVRGLGFMIDCTPSTIAYNLTNDPYNVNNSYLGTQQMQATGAQILSVGVAYNLSENSTVQLRTVWKADENCAGTYNVQTCKLHMADVLYPVVINANVQEATASGLVNSTALSLDLDLLTQQPETLDLLPNGPIDFSDGYAYSDYTPAVAAYLAQAFNSSVQMIYNNDTSTDYYELRVNGVFASDQIATNSEFTYDPTFAVAVPPCARTFDTSLHSQLLAAIQSATFQLSVYSNLQVRANNVVAGDYSDHPLSTQTYHRNEYVVVWGWYFGALATTVLIALAISPLFYGYWLLPRKTTMAPFETARAFRAPVLYQEDSRIGSSELIKRVGGINIHRDLGVRTGTAM